MRSYMDSNIKHHQSDVADQQGDYAHQKRAQQKGVIHQQRDVENIAYSTPSVVQTESSASRQMVPTPLWSYDAEKASNFSTSGMQMRHHADATEGISVDQPVLPPAYHSIEHNTK